VERRLRVAAPAHGGRREGLRSVYQAPPAVPPLSLPKDVGDNASGACNQVQCKWIYPAASSQYRPNGTERKPVSWMAADSNRPTPRLRAGRCRWRSARLWLHSRGDGNDSRVQRRVWEMLAFASGAAAAAACRTGMKALWRANRHEDPPGNPASRRVRWPDALVWSISLGVGAAVSRLVAQRGAAAAWQAATGARPPGLDDRTE
jgi:hypothetical protein